MKVLNLPADLKKWAMEVSRAGAEVVVVVGLKFDEKMLNWK